MVVGYHKTVKPVGRQALVEVVMKWRSSLPIK